MHARRFRIGLIWLVVRREPNPRPLIQKTRLLSTEPTYQSKFKWGYTTYNIMYAKFYSHLCIMSFYLYYTHFLKYTLRFFYYDDDLFRLLFTSKKTIIISLKCDPYCMAMINFKIIYFCR